MAFAIAKERGYFGSIVEPGDRFEVPDGTESNSWFTVEGEDAAPRASKSKKAAVALVEGEDAASVI